MGRQRRKNSFQKLINSESIGTMGKNARTVWGSILCGIGTFFVVFAFFSFLDLQEAKENTKVLQSMVNGISYSIGKGMSRQIGVPFNQPPQMDITKSKYYQDAIDGSERRIWFFLITGMMMGAGGTMLLSNNRKTTRIKINRPPLPPTDYDIRIR